MLRFSPRTRRGSICGGTVGLALFLLIGFVVSVFACDDSTTTTVVPTTGILIRAEQLTAGRGCGTGPTEIYKYAVVVFQYGGTGDPEQRVNYTLPYTSNVFDCYVDGEFVSLAAVGTNETYRFEVYAYNADAFNATPQVITAAGTKTSDLKNLTKPTYTTQCTATQSDQVEQLALCDPLSAGLAGVGAGPDGGFQTQITLTTQSFHLPDGTTAVCVPPSDTLDAGTDAGADADAGVDASEDAEAGIADAEAGVVDASDNASADAGVPADAGPLPVPFAKVRVRARIGGNVVAQPVDIACPTTYVANVDSLPQTYTVDVGLIDDAGNPIGQTACTVTTQTGVPNPVACP